MSGMKCKLFIYTGIDGKLLTGQGSGTINHSAETIDATIKTSEGNWKFGFKFLFLHISSKIFIAEVFCENKAF